MLNNIRLNATVVIFTVITLFVLLFIYSPASAAINIAKNKPYTLHPRPSYGRMPDTDAQTVLTDGKTIPEGKLMWAGSVSGKVQWKVNNRKSMPSITVDLEKVQPISGVALHAGGGASGGGFPSVIYIQISKDGKTFHTIGDLVQLDESLSPPRYKQKNESRTHWFRTNSLQTKGRYIRFKMIGSIRWLSCDEVQIYKGDKSLLEKPIGGKVLNKNQLINSLKLTRKGVARRCRLDLSAVREAVEKHSPNKSVKQELLKDVRQLEKQARKPSKYPQSLKNFKAVVPVGRLDAKILSVYGKLLAETGHKPLTIWQSDTYRMLPLLQRPGAPVTDIKLRMMQNEHRAKVFNITNASTNAREVKFNIKNLPASSLKVYQVDYVDMSEGRPVATALTHPEKNGNTYSVTVPAGMTQQVFLDVDSSDLSAKNYKATISLHSIDWDEYLEFTVSVAPFRMANRMALNTGDWDYIADERYRATDNNKKKLRSLIKSRGVNVAKLHDRGTHGVVPIPKRSAFDEDGNLTGKISYKKWDDAIKFWGKSMRFYAIANGYFRKSGGGARDNFAGFKMGTPQFKRAVAQWAKDWAKHNKELGLETGQVLLLFIDEPHSKEQWDAIAKLANAFKQGTNTIPIVEDFTARNIKQIKQAAPMLNAIDIIQPTRQAYNSMSKQVKQAYQDFVKQGNQLWFYMCVGSTKQFSPSYYLMQPWHAYNVGATGSGFWGYTDIRSTNNNWNPYTKKTQSSDRTDYSPLMLSPTSASTTKHWEAMSEGVEDYQYLTILAEKKGKDAARAVAKHVAGGLLKRQGRFYYLGWNNSCRLAKQGRLHILDLLTTDANNN